MKNLTLNLNSNYLGQNAENFNYLEEAMKQLPNNLDTFSLNLSENNLERNS